MENDVLVKAEAKEFIDEVFTCEHDAAMNTGVSRTANVCGRDQRGGKAQLLVVIVHEEEKVGSLQ